MKKQLTISQQLAWKPNPEKNPVVRYPVKEGRNLPNSETEDVGGFSLCPTYSGRQLRTIRCLMIRQVQASPQRKMKLKHGGRFQWY